MRRAAGPILFGLFFVAVFATGLTIGTYNPPAQKQRAEQTIKKSTNIEPWLTKDAAGFFTFLLVIVTSAQLGFFFWQLKLIRKGLVDTKEAADASADAARAAQEAAKAATRQAKVAEEMLSKKERPYLFASGPRYIKKNEKFHSYYVDFSLRNCGMLPAIIDQAFFDVMPGKEKGLETPGCIGNWHSVVRDNVMSAGEHRANITFNIRPRLISGETDGVVMVFRKDGKSDEHPIPIFDIGDDECVFFRMILKYSGPFSRGHEVGATWIYDSGMHEFVKWGGEKYNYYT